MNRVHVEITTMKDRRRANFTVPALLAATPALLAAAPGLTQQICNDRMNATASVDRMIIQTDGTVLDSITGLIWMRCPLGFSVDDNGTADDFTDDRCAADGGPAGFNWQGALQAAEALNLGGGFAGAAGWRVPSIKELASIVERKCMLPALNETVFPAADVTPQLWSSTTYNLINEAAVFSFDLGTPTSNFKDVPGNDAFLRGVRLAR